MLTKTLFTYCTLFITLATAAFVQIESGLDLILVFLFLMLMPLTYFAFLGSHVYIHHKRFKYSSGIVVKGLSAILPVLAGLSLGYSFDMQFLLTSIGFGIGTILLFVMSLS